MHDMFVFDVNEDCDPVPVSLVNLADAWSKGRVVALFDRSGMPHVGIITGIKMESGYLLGGHPEHFLVTLQRRDASHEVYVRMKRQGSAVVVQ